ncbi:hypothetical protein EHS13_20070 [Paenibacillus psychroresistens]|uniref:Uncharacterized protein n=1 Tax=Paenibacillus psychroresistens TaxID=1778678 RepID=A0A6B8RNS5_9BACL|nr:hypothetical protein [Paenibacillus psychroresistens]QGQ97016.1 hypothetical protein EHS13_20070 [Paenibacillus psychroresistens]
MIIRDDVHYEKGLKWLAGEAERLEELEIHDKLARPEWKAELLINYNKAEGNLLMYQRAKNVLAYPELKTEYREIGWAFEEPAPEIVPEPIALPAPIANNWLNED